MTKVASSTYKRPSRPWITTIITGLIITLLGGYIIFQTENFIQLLVICIGIYAFIIGVFAIIAGLRIREDRARRRTIIIRGLLNMIVGGIAIGLPLLFAGLTWTIMLYVVAFQFVVAAVLEFVVAYQLRQNRLPMGPALFGGFISLAFAALLFAAPEFLGLTLVWAFGLIILLVGLFTIYIGWRQRSLR